jgi:hypothetical protein
VLVEHRGVGVAHDDVGGHSLAAQPDPGDGPASRLDRRDGGGEVHVDPEQAATVQQRVGQPSQPAADVPGAEPLLDVGRDRQHRWRAPRVGAGVGGVTVEPGAHPRVRQHRRAKAAQGEPGRDHAQVAQPGGEAQEVAGRERAAQHVVAGELPQPFAPCVQRGPRCPAAWPESRVERGGDGGRVVGHVQDRPVGEGVGAGRVDRHDVEARRTTGVGEQLPDDLRQRQQRRAGIEGEAVAAELPELAAVGGRLLVDLHALAHPASIGALLALVARSWADHRRGTLSWKGRTL